MNLDVNNDEHMTQNRSQYVNQLLERNRQVIRIWVVISYVVRNSASSRKIKRTGIE